MHKPSGKNQNCLDGVVCPVCGQEDKILVKAEVVVAVTDDGTDFFDDAVNDRDVGYGPDSDCRCPKCGHEATLGDFTPGPPGGETPDPLTALKEAVAWMEGQDEAETLDHDLDGHDAGSCVLCRCRAAIEAAEGDAE